MEKEEIELKLIEFCLNNFTEFESFSDFNIYHEDLLNFKKYLNSKIETERLLNELGNERFI